MTNADAIFLQQSNLIEGEPGDGEAFYDAAAAWMFLRFEPKLTETAIVECHRLLMRSRTTIDEYEKGAYRTGGVVVGGWYAPRPEEVQSLMSRFVRGINATIPTYGSRDVQPRVRDKVAQDFHVEFEKIHPFFDGNGRVGRIIWNWHRLKLGLRMKMIWNKDKAAYYAWFK